MSSTPTRYDPKTAEPRQQARWADADAFVTRDTGRPKYYVLEMFPYPSGNIHMGHARNYVMGDVVARHKRAQGFDVLHPMGWDAFGMPAENAAMERGIHPKGWTYDNIASMRAQLKLLGLSPDDVTDVVLSHHHPDHTVNIALFGEIPVHDVQAVYQRDCWTQRPAEGVLLTPSVRLLATPGHTPQDLTTVVGTADGLIALSHLWWTAEGPADDPYATDRDLLRVQRERVLALADRVVPGHGPAFVPDGSTPR